MKLRIDFVTNSSSSSYILAYKLDIPEFIIGEQRVALVATAEKVIQDFSDAKVFKAFDDFKEYFMREWDYEGDEKIFNKAKKHFDEGKWLTYVEVPYGGEGPEWVCSKVFERVDCW